MGQMMIIRDKVSEARSALASLIYRLRAHADVLKESDPERIAEVADEVMVSVAEDLDTVLEYLRALDSIGDDELSLRDLVLAGDSIFVDIVTPDGPGRLTLSPDEEREPVSLVRSTPPLVRAWASLIAM